MMLSDMHRQKLIESTGKSNAATN